MRKTRMVFRLGLALSFVLLFASQARTQDAPAQGQAIKVQVARVNVGVVVTDEKGKFVEGLGRDSFHVYDNSTEQPITEFAPVEEPGQVLILIEAGPAAYFLQQANLFAADSMLKGLSPGDRVAIARYTDQPLGIMDWTTDKNAAQFALDSISFTLGFADLNLSASLYSVLDWLERVPGKKTIVLISTGVDTSAPAAVAALQSRLQIGDVRILCVSTSGPLRNGKQGKKAAIQQTDEEFQAADNLLRWIAQSTGGRAYFPLNAKAFDEAYKEIAQIVRHEYSLAFAPPAADGAVHTIDVKVDPSDKKSSYRIDHRRAYQAPK